MKARTKGFSDLQSNIDSPEASEVKAIAVGAEARRSTRAAIEELGLAGNYSTARTSPASPWPAIPTRGSSIGAHRVRLQAAAGPLPEPGAGREQRAERAGLRRLLQEERRARGEHELGRHVEGVEGELELCGIGKTPDERKALAREYFDIAEEGADGRVRQRAGDPVRHRRRQLQRATRASTRPSRPASCCPTCSRSARSTRPATRRRSRATARPSKVHANGYQVESYLPGGDRGRALGHLDGLAAGRQPRGQDAGGQPEAHSRPEVIAIIVDTAERTADGRRNLDASRRRPSRLRRGPCADAARALRSRSRRGASARRAPASRGPSGPSP